MLQLYYLISNAIKQHSRNIKESFRYAISLTVYFVGATVMYHLFLAFRLILNYVSNRTTNNIDMQSVDTTSFLQIFITVFTYTCFLFVVGLVLFGISQLTINTQRNYLIEKNDLTIYQLTGGSTFSVTLQFFLDNYLLIPIIFPISVFLSSFLIKAIIIGAQNAFPIEEIPGLNALSIGTSFVLFSVLMIAASLIVNFIIVYWNLKKLNIT